MAKIYAPNKNYTGVSASVPFVNGVGETKDAHLIEWFESHGYQVEKPSKKDPDKKPETPEKKPAK